jgi:translation elongation factor EF-1alpha
MLLGLGKVTQQEVNRQSDAATQWGKGSFMYAWCSDRTDAERQRGYSMRAIIISSVDKH